MFSRLGGASGIKDVQAAIEATAFPCNDPKSAKTKVVYTFHGLSIEFEYVEGQVRPFVGKDGKKGGTPMPCAYGFIPGVIDNDGEEIDVSMAQSQFVDSQVVYVIDQIDPDTRAFDEHKIFLGFGSEDAAVDTYNRMLGGTGLKRIGAVSKTTAPELLTWLASSGIKKPFAGQLADAPAPTVESSAAALPDRARTLFINLPKLGVAPFVTTVVDPKTKNLRMNLNITTKFMTSVWGPTIEVVIQFLDRAIDGDRLVITLASPGGEVTLASRLAAAIRRSKAHVSTVAIGGVASAASMVWCEGDSLYVAPLAYIMQHMSSHADAGYTAKIERNAHVIGQYVRNTMLAKAIEIGLITEDDLTDMVESNRDVYLSADEVVRRTSATYIRRWSDVN